MSDEPQLPASNHSRDDNAAAASNGGLGAYDFAQLLFRCVTPLHIGCGQDVGIVDLPVIRERVTGYPFVPGSGIRGVFRERCERRSVPEAIRLFGAEKAETAGCVVVVDAKLLFFPVRSTPGVFRWVTCRHVLDRYRRDAEYFLGAAPADPPGLPPTGPEEGTFAGRRPEEQLYLEDLELAHDPALTWTCNRPPGGADTEVILVSDEDFHYFVSNATHVAQHNHLSSAKTVLPGQLFSVEAVPPEAVFYGFLGTTGERSGVATPWKPSDAMAKVREHLTGSAGGAELHAIFGGDEGTGLGLTQVFWS